MQPNSPVNLDRQISFNIEENYSQAQLDNIAKAIFTREGCRDLKSATLYHGTGRDNVSTVLQGPREDLGHPKACGGPGLYVAINDRNVAVHNAGKGGQLPTVLQGKLNQHTDFIVAEIELVRPGVAHNLLKGKFPADWQQNPVLREMVTRRFDILVIKNAHKNEVAAMSDHFAVIHERAGHKAVVWNGAYGVSNQPVCPELFTRSTNRTFDPSIKGQPMLQAPTAGYFLHRSRADLDHEFTQVRGYEKVDENNYVHKSSGYKVHIDPERQELYIRKPGSTKQSVKMYDEKGEKLLHSSNWYTDARRYRYDVQTRDGIYFEYHPSKPYEPKPKVEAKGEGKHHYKSAQDIDTELVIHRKYERKGQNHYVHPETGTAITVNPEHNKMHVRTKEGYERTFEYGNKKPSAGGKIARGIKQPPADILEVCRGKSPQEAKQILWKEGWRKLEQGPNKVAYEKMSTNPRFEGARNQEAGMITLDETTGRVTRTKTVQGKTETHEASLKTTPKTENGTAPKKTPLRNVTVKGNNLKAKGRTALYSAEYVIAAYEIVNEMIKNDAPLKETLGAVGKMVLESAGAVGAHRIGGRAGALVYGAAVAASRLAGNKPQTHEERVAQNAAVTGAGIAIGASAIPGVNITLGVSWVLTWAAGKLETWHEKYEDKNPLVHKMIKGLHELSALPDKGITMASEALAEKFTKMPELPSDADRGITTPEQQKWIDEIYGWQDDPSPHHANSEGLPAVAAAAAEGAAEPLTRLFMACTGNNEKSPLEDYAEQAALLASQAVSFDPKELLKQEEAVKKLAERTGKIEEILDEQQKKEFWKNLTEAVDTGIQETFSALHAIEDANQEKRQLREEEKQLKAHAKAGEQHLQQAENRNLYPSDTRSFERKAGEYLNKWSSRELADEMVKAFAELRTEIDQAKACLADAKDGLHATNKNAVKLHKAHAKAMRAKSRLTKGLSITGLISRVAGAACLVIPGAQALAPAFMGAGSAAKEGAQYYNRVKNDKLQGKQAKSAQKSQQIAAGWMQQGEEDVAELAHLQAVQEQNYESLRKIGRHVASASRIALWKSAGTSLSQKRGEISAALEKGKRAAAQADANVKALQDQKVRKKHRDAHQQKILAAQLEQAKRNKNVKALEDQNIACGEELGKASKDYNTAVYVAPQQTRRQEVEEQYEGYSRKDDTAEKKDIRENQAEAVQEFQDTLAAHARNTQLQDFVVHSTLDAASKLAYVGSDMLGSDKPSKFIAAGAKGYELYEIYRRISTFLAEGGEFWTKYGDGLKGEWDKKNYLAFTKEALVSTVFLHFVGPAAGGIATAWSLYRLSKSILYGKKYGWIAQARYAEAGVQVGFKEADRSNYFKTIGVQSPPAWSPELEAQLHALEHEADGIKKHVDQRLDQLCHLWDSKVSSGFADLKNKLARIHERVLSELRSMEAHLLAQGNKLAYDQVTSRVATRAQEFSRDFDKAIAEIKVREVIDASKENGANLDARSKKIEMILIELTSLLKEMVAFNYSALLATDAGNTNEPSVLLTHIYQKPSDFTALLGNAVNRKVPNLTLYLALLEKFTTKLVELQGEKLAFQQLKAGIEGNAALKKRFELFFATVRSYKNGIDFVAREGMSILIQQLLQTQAKMREELGVRVHEVRVRTARQVEWEQRRAVADTLKLLEQLQPTLVGEKKFYLNEGITTEQVGKIAPHWDFIDVYSNAHNYVTATVPVTVGGLCTLGAGIDLKNIRNGSLLPENRFIVATSLLALVGLYLLNKGIEHVNDGAEGWGWMTVPKRERLTEQTTEFQKVLSVPLQQLAQSAHHYITFQTLRKVHRQANFYLDIKARKIVYMAGGYDKTAQVPFFQITLDVDQPKASVQLVQGSPVKPNELSKVAPPTGVILYRDKLTNLVLNYALLLNSHVAKLGLSAINPFCSILNTFEMVPSGHEKETLALVFPKPLINHLKSKLFPHLHQLEAGGRGTLTPAYTIACHDTELVLSIHFRHTTRNGNVQSFKGIPVARFSGKTVRSFMSNLEQAQKPLDGSLPWATYNEFILQAMFAGFARLGFPGQGTLELESGLIAPVERESFPGLYKIWEKFPDQLIDFNCDTYTEQAMLKLNASLESGTIDPACAHLFAPLGEFRPDADYFNVIDEIDDGKKCSEALEKQFTEQYALLYATARLISPTDETHFKGSLTQQLGIFPPNQITALFDTWLLPAASIQPRLIEAFIHPYYSRPSDTICKLEELYAEALIFEEKLGLKTNEKPIVVLHGGRERKLDNGVVHKPAAPSVRVCNKIVGFPNLGNSCYINASLQGLLATASFKASLKRIDALTQKSRTQTNLLQLDNAVSSKRNVRGSLIDLRHAIFADHKDLSDFATGLTEQKCAASLMLNVLKQAGHQILIRDQRVAGTHRGEIRLDPSPIIPLAIPDQMEPLALEELLEAHMNEQTDSLWTPEPGVNYTNSIVTRRIHTALPDLLVIQLKRSFMDKTGIKRKIQTPVVMPKDGILDMKSYVLEGVAGSTQYVLKACVDHQGTPDDGHYTASVKSENDWIEVSDAVLDPITWQDVVDDKHYLYIFERRQ